MFAKAARIRAAFLFEVGSALAIEADTGPVANACAV